MYKERMLSYWPEAVRRVLDMQAVIDAEAPELTLIGTAEQYVLDDSRLGTMNEARIAEWEQILGITPVSGSTLENRRDTIIARIRGSGKLNTELINNIVNAFTGGTARSWVANSNLYVEILPPPDNKQFFFENVEKELARRKPAHLGLSVSRNYYTWQAIKDDFDDWQDVLTRQETWGEVLLYQPFAQAQGD